MRIRPLSKLTLLTVCALFLFSASSGADEDVHGCSEMEVWDITRWMCMPLPMADMPMTMLMLHGNAFAVRIWEQGPRARDAWAGPGMVMAELGTSVGNRHYLNLEFMGTADKWTFPDRGYPLLTQIGEQDANGRPFVDAQHPHSSPVMGLTLSDTIKLDSGEKDYLKPFFAPRGQSTDGPIAFMHRPTGMANPDAPLGHHVGQDVGHISSTVIGASLKLGAMIYEASTFHGTEPLPENVDLPVRTPNSGAFRILREFTPRLSVMASVAYVRSPEPTDPDISSVMRYSMSGYHQIQLSGDWTFFNSLIFGAITGMDHASSLYSFAEEFLFSSLQSGHPNFWGRIELLQRTSDQLVTGAVPPTSARWVEATTLGYTHTVAQIDEAKLGLGGSVTKTLLPGDFIGPYGGDPWSGKVFLQLSGMKMWGL